MFTCVRCGESLREGAKFCAKCGNRVVATLDEVEAAQNGSEASIPVSQQIQQHAPAINSGFTDQASKTLAAEPLQTASVASGHALPQPHPIQNNGAFQATIQRSASTTTAIPASTEPLSEEASEVAAWRWNWGAFLLPGSWLLAHRIKPKIFALILLGIPLLVAAIYTATAIFGARAAEHSPTGGPVNFGVGNSPDALWNAATIASGWLLGLYVLACLFSIRSARRASLDAWRNFPSQNLPAFRSAQRWWSAGGLAFCLLMVLINVYVWSRFNYWEAKASQHYIF